MSFTGCSWPDISTTNIKKFRIMHNHGGRLSITNITGQQLYLLPRSPCGLTPSVKSARRRFLGFDSNPSHKLSILFHDSASFWCFNNLIVSPFLTCHVNKLDVSLLRNSISNLGIGEKYHMTFAITFLPPSFKFLWRFHFDVPQMGHSFASESSFLNKQQSLIHAWIFSYFIPWVHKIFFPW